MELASYEYLIDKYLSPENKDIYLFILNKLYDNNELDVFEQLDVIIVNELDNSTTDIPLLVVNIIISNCIRYISKFYFINFKIGNNYLITDIYNVLFVLEYLSGIDIVRADEFNSILINNDLDNLEKASKIFNILGIDEFFMLENLDSVSDDFISAFSIYVNSVLNNENEIDLDVLNTRIKLNKYLNILESINIDKKSLLGVRLFKQNQNPLNIDLILNLLDDLPDDNYLSLEILAILVLSDIEDKITEYKDTIDPIIETKDKERLFKDIVNLLNIFNSKLMELEK